MCLTIYIIKAAHIYTYTAAKYFSNLIKYETILKIQIHHNCETFATILFAKTGN